MIEKTNLRKGVVASLLWSPIMAWSASSHGIIALRGVQICFPRGCAQCWAPISYMEVFVQCVFVIVADSLVVSPTHVWAGELIGLWPHASSIGWVFVFCCLPFLCCTRISLTWFSCCALFHFAAPHLQVSVPWSSICICVFVSHQLHLLQVGLTCCHFNACSMHCYILCLSHIALGWRWWIPNVNLSAGSYCLYHAMSSMDLLGLRFLSHRELCLLFYSSNLLMCIATVCVHRQGVWGAISHMSVCLPYMWGRHWVFIHVAHIMFWVILSMMKFWWPNHHGMAALIKSRLYVYIYIYIYTALARYIPKREKTKYGTPGFG